MKRRLVALLLAAAFTTASAPAARYDILIQGGTIIDGSGGAPFHGDVGIVGQRIAYVGPHAAGTGARVIDASGQAVTPGFINMLSQADEALLVDGRALSDLAQGVTLEVMGEGTSMGPLSPAMRARIATDQGDLPFKVSWTTLDGFLRTLERRGVSVNIASSVGAGAIRENVLGRDNVRATPSQLKHMRRLVAQAMADGAIGLSSALIYTPDTFADSAELTTLATEAGRCGGGYWSHIRSEGDRIVEAVDDMITLAGATGASAEIFHLKVVGRANWPKFDSVIARIDAARARGVKISANAYVYDASSTGLDPSMPAWVQEGSIDDWIARLKAPDTRARALADMRRDPPVFESRLRQAGAEGVLLTGFKTDALKPLIGRRLADVARERGTSPEELAMDLVIADHSRVSVVYFAMSEANVRKTVATPWVTFASDGSAQAPEGAFLKSSTHPRTYGNFARLLGRYVRDERLIPLEQAVHRLTMLPAQRLGLHDRGQLKIGHFADVAIFDPTQIGDRATFEQPQQLATGMNYVIVNGRVAFDHGTATAVRAGQVIRGRGWRGWKDGGCRASARAWSW
ncbi:MAG: aminoacylase [Sphingomonas sp. 28-62-20]|uniref:N-acyl-D-amino-acid deacylase family protein n=1 Tax=Sphingomonas sp. 28-62-20 TaxID=1970433 RepID=UPI000BD82C0B|nr:MAG: aminoacylase [Sphingomonas sp. 28-62-20]